MRKVILVAIGLLWLPNGSVVADEFCDDFARLPPSRYPELVEATWRKTLRDNPDWREAFNLCGPLAFKEQCAHYGEAPPDGQLFYPDVSRFIAQCLARKRARSGD